MARIAKYRSLVLFLILILILIGAAVVYSQVPMVDPVRLADLQEALLFIADADLLLEADSTEIDAYWTAQTGSPPDLGNYGSLIYAARNDLNSANAELVSAQNAYWAGVPHSLGTLETLASRANGGYWSAESILEPFFNIAHPDIEPNTLNDLTADDHLAEASLLITPN